MSDFFEEYGFTMVAAIGAMLVMSFFMFGMNFDGFIGQFIVELAQKYIGG